MKLMLVQRVGDWAGPQPAQAPTRCTRCNSPPINGQCNNHRVAVGLCGFRVPQCIGMQPFSNSSELLVIRCSRKNVVMISQTVQKLSC